MKKLERVDVELHSPLHPVQDGSDLPSSTPRPDRFTPGEEASLIHSTESWTDSRSCLDTVEKKIVSSVFYP